MSEPNVTYRIDIDGPDQETTRRETQRVVEAIWRHLQDNPERPVRAIYFGIAFEDEGICHQEIAGARTDLAFMLAAIKKTVGIR